MGSAALLVALALTGCAESGKHSDVVPPSASPGAVTLAPATAATATAATATAATATAATATAAVTPTAADIVVPPSVAASEQPRPFVLLLHGYQGSGQSIARHFGLAELAVSRRLVWAAPDGAQDSRGQRFWNTGPACCDFEGSGVDHLGQLRGLLDRARAEPHVDASQLIVVGYSNGGFMAHRLGCEVVGVAAVGSIAGSPPTDLSGCKNRPQFVIQVHGDNDKVVRFAGGRVLDKENVAPHPGPVAGLAGWARQLGCPASARPAGRLDLEPGLDGEETERLRFGPCDATIELWRVAGGGHGVVANRSAFARILDSLIRTKP